MVIGRVEIRIVQKIQQYQPTTTRALRSLKSLSLFSLQLFSHQVVDPTREKMRMKIATSLLLCISAAAAAAAPSDDDGRGGGDLSEWIHKNSVMFFSVVAAVVFFACLIIHRCCNDNGDDGQDDEEDGRRKSEGTGSDWRVSHGSNDNETGAESGSVELGDYLPVRGRGDRTHLLAYLLTCLLTHLLPTCPWTGRSNARPGGVVGW